IDRDQVSELSAESLLRCMIGLRRECASLVIRTIRASARDTLARPCKRSIFSRLLRLLDFDPDAIAPIAVAFVLAPPVLLVLVLGPFPAVRMDGELKAGMKIVPLDVPAIAFAVARNLGRRCRYTEGQGTCSNQKGF